MESNLAACEVCGKTYLNCVYCARSEKELELFQYHHEVLAIMATNYHNSFAENVSITPKILKTIFHVQRVRKDINLDAMISRWSNFILNAIGQETLIHMKRHHFQIVLCNFALMQAVLPSNWSQIPQVVKTYLRTAHIDSQCPVENFMGAFNESLINAANICNELQLNNNEMRFLLTLVVVDNQCSSEEPEACVVGNALVFFERSYMQDERLIRFAKLLQLYVMVQKLVDYMTPSRLLSPLVREYDEFPMPKNQMDAIGVILFDFPTKIIL